MRALLWVSVVLMALWSGYWFVGRSAVETATTGFFDGAAQRGFIAEKSGHQIAGFPNRFDLTVTDPRLADPRTGLEWTAPFVQIFSLSYKPWHLIMAFPPEQVITSPTDRIVVQTTGKLQASLIVKPNPDLVLDRTTVVGSGLSFVSDQSGRLAMDEFRFATRLDPTRTHTHEIGVEILGLLPDAAVSAALPDLPAQIERLRIDAFAGFSAPIDRNVGQTRPELTQILMREASLSWGELSVFVSGDLEVQNGIPEGQLDLRVEGWRNLVGLMTASGLVKPEVGPTVERMMEVYALQTGDAAVLNVPLIFSAGQMRLGPLPLGPAPRLN